MRLDQIRSEITVSQIHKLIISTKRLSRNVSLLDSVKLVAKMCVTIRTFLEVRTPLSGADITSNSLQQVFRRLLSFKPSIANPFLCASDVLHFVVQVFFLFDFVLS